MSIGKIRRVGQLLVEYGLVLALISGVVILMVKAVDAKTANAFDNIRCQMPHEGIATSSPTAANSLSPHAVSQRSAFAPLLTT